MDVASPERLLDAKRTLDYYLDKNPIDNMYPAAEIALFVIGVMLVSSGIYNLAKYYKLEKKE